MFFRFRFSFIGFVFRNCFSFLVCRVFVSLFGLSVVFRLFVVRQFCVPPIAFFVFRVAFVFRVSLFRRSFAFRFSFLGFRFSFVCSIFYDVNFEAHFGWQISATYRTCRGEGAGFEPRTIVWADPYYARYYNIIYYYCKMHERDTQHKNANADNSKETLPIRIPHQNTTRQIHTSRALNFLPFKQNSSYGRCSYFLAEMCIRDSPGAPRLHEGKVFLSSCQDVHA